MKLLKVIFSLALILPVAACGGEPSEKDMKHAITETMSGIMGAVGAAGSFEIKKVEKIACVKAKEKAGYQCDLTVTMKMGGQEHTNSDSARFVKSDDGWKMLK